MRSGWEIGLRFMGKLIPIKTTYPNILNASQTEAKWRKFFDINGLHVAYEPNGPNTPPDFWLPDLGIFVEIKPSYLFNKNKDVTDFLREKRYIALYKELSQPLLMIFGSPYILPEGNWDYDAMLITSGRHFNMKETVILHNICFADEQNIITLAWFKPFLFEKQFKSLTLYCYQPFIPPELDKKANIFSQKLRLASKLAIRIKGNHITIAEAERR